MKESLISLRITWSSSGYGFYWVGPHATIAGISMSSPLAQSIADLSSADASKRLAAAGEIYRLGRATAGSAISDWWAESELSSLLFGPNPAITVGLAPGGLGAIAKYLAKFGEGNQQVEYRCANVDRATQILKDKFGISPVYPAPRAGADGTRVNFFLVPSPDGGKVLIELYEWPSRG